MKKQLFQVHLFAFLILFPTIAISQSNLNRLSLGFKVGTNLSNVYDVQGDEFQADAKFGLVGGAFINLPITKYLGIQPELLFSQKGYQGAGSLLGNDYSFTRTTNYIDVPILLSFKSGKYLTLLFGPQYSFLTSQNYTFKSDLIEYSRDEQFTNENLNKNTLCFTGGFDVNLNAFVISARLGWDILSNKGDGTTATHRYKNTWYQLTAGYRF